MTIEAAPAGISFDAEEWVPKTQSKFRLDQVAEFLSVTVNHLFNLIEERELKVPRKNISSAPSRASILVPRESIVSFCQRRHSRNPQRQSFRKAQKRSATASKRARRSREPRSGGKTILQGFAAPKGGKQ